jgi:hypothetical protein
MVRSEEVRPGPAIGSRWGTAVSAWRSARKALPSRPGASGARRTRLLRHGPKRVVAGRPVTTLVQWTALAVGLGAFEDAIRTFGHWLKQAMALPS